MKIHHLGNGVQLWYDHKACCWLAAKFDDDGNQVGQAIDAATKGEIVRLAGQYWPQPATVRVPAKFYNDHDDRGCEPFCNPVKTTKQFVWLRLDDEGLDELLDDAQHYADPDSFGPEYTDLRKSAEATVRAIEAARKAV